MSTLLFHFRQQFVQQNHFTTVVYEMLISCVRRTYTNNYSVIITQACITCSRQLKITRSHPEMVGDMSRVSLNSDLSKISFVRF